MAGHKCSHGSRVPPFAARNSGMNTSRAIEAQTVTLVRTEADEQTRRTEVVHAKTLDHSLGGVI